jgi:peptidoglycan/LPS O-acetylase OafA/YrhL
MPSAAFDLLVAAALVLVAVQVARWLARWFPFVPEQTSGDSRAVALDGLRGYLALLVIVHHASIHRMYWQTGVWEETDSLVHAWLGPAPVALFFMLTGFLFWSKALVGHKCEAGRLWLGRIRRIVPMYLFAGITTYCMAFVLRGGWAAFRPEWIQELLPIFSGGTMFFPPVLGGVVTLSLNAGVTWTLQYEWYFYLALPLLALRATPQTTIAMAMLGAGLAAHGTEIGIASFNFSLGMLAAVIRNQSTPAWVRSWPGLGLCIACVATLALGNGKQTVWSSPAMGTVFVTVACGQDFAGLLTSRTARWLGVISYSVYLMHGIVLQWVMRNLAARAPFQSLSAMAFWEFAILAAALTVVLSAITYQCIEKPFLASPKPA